MGMVSLAVKPRAITLLTVEASGGASISELNSYQYQRMHRNSLFTYVPPVGPVVNAAPRSLRRGYRIQVCYGQLHCKT
jgi:hypothetical protein